MIQHFPWMLLKGQFTITQYSTDLEMLANFDVRSEFRYLFFFSTYIKLCIFFNTPPLGESLKNENSHTSMSEAMKA